MKLKLFLSLLLIVSIFLASPSNVFAACDANIASFDATSRNATVCVGQFDSPAQLLSSTITFNCIDNSNAIGQGCQGTGGQFFTGLEPVVYPLSSTTSTDIAQDSSGKFYTCPIFQGLNRAVGKGSFDISGGQTCSTGEVNTKPSNWNSLIEGNIFGQAAVNAGLVSAPSNAGTIGCIINGSKGINTALGCISYDAVGGGFVRSLLGLAIGLGGGIALLLILYGVFIVTTSAGIPDKLKEGKEIISSAVAGLIFIILAIFLMNLVGIQILKLPGLQ